MSIKKYFEQSGVPKVLHNKDFKSIGEEVESSALIEASLDDRRRFLPPVEYSNPENFAKFGSAEEYYRESFNRIHRTYPYDGSKAEIQKWHNSSSYLDLWVFNEQYPRTTGYVNFSPRGWGTQHSASNIVGSMPTNKEYILIHGGPNVNNKLDLPKNRGNNLELNLNKGVTVEFWMKTGELPADESSGGTDFMTVFDLWNGVTGSNTSHGRLTIDVRNSVAAGTATDNIRLSCTSGTLAAPVGFRPFVNEFNPGVPLTTITSSWHHYAFVVQNSGSNLRATLYLDGRYHSEEHSNGNINQISGTMIATIGASVAYTDYAAIVGGGGYDPGDINNIRGRGWNKFSGSIDEFRFWKTARTPEQIGRYYFSHVGGGTNTDDANTELGVYYKFNEGIFGNNNVDANVLDYSGRVSNGMWHVDSGFDGATYRSTSSAITETYGSDDPTKIPLGEPKDPIMYAGHHSVLSSSAKWIAIGKQYDYNNNASIYHSLPGWLAEEDHIKDRKNILKVTQIISSYFDQLSLQIEHLPRLRDVGYISDQFHTTVLANGLTGSVSGTTKPLPFGEKLLQSQGFITPELFSDANILEQIVHRSDTHLYEEKLNDIKNTIYQNIYNNLSYIYKSKGTEKSFRNLLHCFGVDDDLVKFNLFGDSITHTLENNFVIKAPPKKYADFSRRDTTGSVVYQMSSSAIPNSISYISSSAAGTVQLAQGTAFTLESEVYFPKKFGTEDVINHFPITSLTSSLFGIDDIVKSVADNNTRWPAPGAQYVNFQVKAIKTAMSSKDVRFVLGSSGSLAVMPSLSTEVFYDIYDNTKWNFAVSVRPDKYPWSNTISGTVPAGASNLHVMPGIVEFYGVQCEGDVIRNEFLLTASLTPSERISLTAFGKRVRIGARRSNVTGSLLEICDAKVSSTRYWLDYLDKETIKAHAKDTENYGTLHPYRSAYLYENTGSMLRVPQIDTLALNWDFSTVDQSDANGQFVVDDFSSGSAQLMERYGNVSNSSRWIGQILGRQHTGRGDHFPTNSLQAVDTNYVLSAKQQLPEILVSSKTINILDTDDEAFTRESRPIEYFYSFEKNMFQNVSEEMLNMFATIVDFNNLIGEPINKYRSQYKEMTKLKNLFFERVKKDPDFDQFVDFYKWIDHAVSMMMMELIPASANTSEGIRTVVENYLLDRNKFSNKYPTIEMKPKEPVGQILGINEQLYDWEFGHAPQMTPASSKAIQFNGDGVANEYLQVATSPEFTFSDGATDLPFSISFWAYFDDISNIRNAFNRVGHVRVGPSNTGFAVVLYDAGGGANWRHVSCPYGPADIVAGKWHHIAVTYDAVNAAGLKLYVDGDLKCTGADFGVYANMPGPMAAANDIFIGSDNLSGTPGTSTYGFQGKLDDMAVFSYKELSAAEVATIYNNGCPSNLNNTPLKDFVTAWWRMGDHSADTTSLINDAATSTFYSTHNATAVNIATSNFVDSIESSVIGVACETRDSSKNNCLWWKERAERDDILSTGNSGTDVSKQKILETATTKIAMRHMMHAKNTTGRHAGQTPGPEVATPILLTPDGTEYSGSTYVLRHLSRPYRFKTEKSKIIKGGPLNSYENIRGPEIQVTTVRSLNELHMSYSGPIHEEYAACTDNKTPEALDKVKLHFTTRMTTRGGNQLVGGDYAYGKQSLLGPAFTAFSSSTPTTSGSRMPYFLKHEVHANITNLHHDFYSNPDFEIPAQGPFTEKYVGGHPVRHVNITYDPTVESWHRPEAALEVVTTMATPPYVSDFAYKNPFVVHPKIARADWTLGPKRPINIANHPHTMSSPTIIGNYEHNYQVVHSTGRNVNNLWFVKAEGVDAETAESTMISGTLDFLLPSRDRFPNGKRNRTIIAERFSAPGDPSTLSRGFLDVESETFAVNNALPYRNLSVRSLFTRIDAVTPGYLTRHCGQFGLDSVNVGTLMPEDDSNYQLNYVESGSYHKVHRNVSRTPKSGSASILIEADYDNWYIQHQIPQSDRQYAWITASLNTHGYGESAPFGFATDTDQITFVSASDFVSFVDGSPFGRWFGRDYDSAAAVGYGLVHTDFVGLNNNIYEPITSSSNLLGYASGPTGYKTLATTWQYKGGLIGRNVYSGQGDALLNGIILHRQGPYGWPTWKQIRGSEHPIVRHMRANNRIAVSDTYQFNVYKNKTKANWVHTAHGGLVLTPETTVEFDGYRKKLSPTFTSYKETPITSKFKPLTNTLLTRQESIEQPGKRRLRIRHTFGNNLVAFTKQRFDSISDGFTKDNPKDLNAKVETKNHLDKDEQIYKQTLELYKQYMPSGQFGTILGNVSPITDFEDLTYRETIYPKESNTYFGHVRERTQFEEVAGTGSNGYDRLDHRTYWRDSLADRNRTEGVALNSQGFVMNPATSGSHWFLVSTSGSESDNTRIRGKTQTHALSLWPLDNSSSINPGGELNISSVASTIGTRWAAAKAIISLSPVSGYSASLGKQDGASNRTRVILKDDITTYAFTASNATTTIDSGTPYTFNCTASANPHGACGELAMAINNSEASASFYAIPAKLRTTKTDSVIIYANTGSAFFNATNGNAFRICVSSSDGKTAKISSKFIANAKEGDIPASNEDGYFGANISPAVALWSGARANSQTGSFQGGTNHTTPLESRFIKQRFNKYAAEFDGSSHWLDLGSHAAPAFDLESGTISAWIKYDASMLSPSNHGGGIVELGMTSGKTMYLYGSGAERYLAMDISFNSQHGQWYSSKILEPERWYHVCVTYQSMSALDTAANYFGNSQARPQFYIDGAWQNQNNVTTNLIPSGIQDLISGDSIIGAANQSAPAGTQYYKGLIDEVSIWDAPLTSDEIVEIYISGSCLGPTNLTSSHSKAANLVSWYRMGDHSLDDLSLGAAGGNIQDCVGTNHGFLNGLAALTKQLGDLTRGYCRSKLHSPTSGSVASAQYQRAASDYMILDTKVPTDPASETYGISSGSSIAHYYTDKLAGRGPFYDSYDDYTEGITRLVGQDYTIIPEFRISEHMPYYMQSGQFDGSLKNDKFMTLEGALHTASANSETGLGDGDTSHLNDDFYKVYSNTDFLEYFGMLKTDHELTNEYTTDHLFSQKGKKSRVKLERITLSCEAIKKFLPYNGFYPQMRTLQLASMFSQSVAPILIMSGATNVYTKAEGQSSLTLPGSPPHISASTMVQAALTPFFAPGILYNSIKSGIGVPWPAYNKIPDLWPRSHTNNDKPWYPSLHNAPDYKIPFETINDMQALPAVVVDPTSGEVNNLIRMAEPAWSSGSIDKTTEVIHWNKALHAKANFGFDSDAKSVISFENYNRAMDNFLGGTADFFLKDNTISSIRMDASLGQGIGKPEASTKGTLILNPGDEAEEQVTIDFGSPTNLTEQAIEENSWFTQNDIKYVPPLTNDDTLYFVDMGTVYYMDITIYKTDDFVMFEGPAESGSANYGITQRGAPYGPPVRYYSHFVDAEHTTENYGKFPVPVAEDPAYAPYTPPYFYGASTLRIELDPFLIWRHRLGNLINTAMKDNDSLDGGTGSGVGSLNKLTWENWQEFLAEEVANGNDFGMETEWDPFITYKEIYNYCRESIKKYVHKNENVHVRINNNFHHGWANGNVLNPRAPAGKMRNRITDSVDVFAKDDNQWSIIPKMEFPILNFAADNQYQNSSTGRGMWSGYSLDEGTNKQGVFLEVKDPFESHGLQPGQIIAVEDPYKQKASSVPYMILSTDWDPTRVGWSGTSGRGTEGMRITFRMPPTTYTYQKVLSGNEIFEKTFEIPEKIWSFYSASAGETATVSNVGSPHYNSWPAPIQDDMNFDANYLVGDADASNKNTYYSFHGFRADIPVDLSSLPKVNTYNRIDLLKAVRDAINNDTSTFKKHIITGAAGDKTIAKTINGVFSASIDSDYFRVWDPELIKVPNQVPIGGWAEPSDADKKAHSRLVVYVCPHTETAIDSSKGSPYANESPDITKHITPGTTNIVPAPTQAPGKLFDGMGQAFKTIANDLTMGNRINIWCHTGSAPGTLIASGAFCYNLTIFDHSEQAYKGMFEYDVNPAGHGIAGGCLWRSPISIAAAVDSGLGAEKAQGQAKARDGVGIEEIVNEFGYSNVGSFDLDKIKSQQVPEFYSWEETRPLWSGGQSTELAGPWGPYNVLGPQSLSDPQTYFNDTVPIDSTITGTFVGGNNYSPTTDEEYYEETYPDTQVDRPVGSLADLIGFPKNSPKKLGKLKATKTIYEAIVAIPFVEDSHDLYGCAQEDTDGHVVPLPHPGYSLGGKRFFAIDADEWNMQRNNIVAGNPAVLHSQKEDKLKNITSGDIQETSISKLYKMMQKYVFPPHLDFIATANNAQKTRPIVMYVMEFATNFQKEDLMDIWQGVLPNATKLNPCRAVYDKSEFSHYVSQHEFFHGCPPPADTKWMVFKVKQRGTRSLKAVRPGDVPTIGRMSYNWPYDYCSTVELAKITAETKISKNTEKDEAAAEFINPDVLAAGPANLVDLGILAGATAKGCTWASATDTTAPAGQDDGSCCFWLDADGKCTDPPMAYAGDNGNAWNTSQLYQEWIGAGAPLPFTIETDSGGKYAKVNPAWTAVFHSPFRINIWNTNRPDLEINIDTNTVKGLGTPYK